MDLASPVALIGQGWTRMTTGQSGAVVMRSQDGARFAKFVPTDQRPVLEAERDRLVWAGEHGIPTARVIEWNNTDGEWVGLLTSAVAGVAANQLSAADLFQAWPSIAIALRDLHSVTTADCPFDRGLTTMFALATDVVERDAVDPQFLPTEAAQLPAADLLGRLTAELTQRAAEEQADEVVCHGDLCLPNVMVNPASHAVTGFVDLGRLGRADRYADIALLLANARGTWDDEDQAQAADELFADVYGISLSPDRRHFYLCLDGLTWGRT